VLGIREARIDFPLEPELVLTSGVRYLASSSFIPHHLSVDGVTSTLKSAAPAAVGGLIGVAVLTVCYRTDSLCQWVQVSTFDATVTLTLSFL